MPKLTRVVDFNFQLLNLFSSFNLKFHFILWNKGNQFPRYFFSK